MKKITIVEFCNEEGEWTFYSAYEGVDLEKAVLHYLEESGIEADEEVIHFLDEGDLGIDGIVRAYEGTLETLSNGGDKNE